MQIPWLPFSSSPPPSTARPGKIGQRLLEVLQDMGHAGCLRGIYHEPAPDLAAFEHIILGASVCYGRHDKRMTKFVKTNREILDRRISGFFSINLTARKPGKDRTDTNPYLKIFLRKTGWQPQYLPVFAGRLDYPRYNVLDRLLIRGIMALTGGPTDARVSVEYTDWQQVAEFGRLIGR